MPKPKPIAHMPKPERADANGAASLPAPPHLPSVKEVEEYGTMHGVPADYCRHYHAVCTEKHRWLVGRPGRERLLGWQSEMKRWWEKDRSTWKAKGPKGEAREIQEEIRVKML